jgi:hypothetical protein
MNATEKHFDGAAWTGIRDFLYLQNDNKVIFELRSIEDYEDLQGIDTILQQLSQDITFYHDSLENGTGSVRIDYATYQQKKQREIRFTKHPSFGEAFVTKEGETQRLKIERDTIRIIIKDISSPDMKVTLKTPDTVIPRFVSHVIYAVQITLVLNNYKDIGKIIAEKEVLLHAMDTFVKARAPKEKKLSFATPTSCIFKPYVSGRMNRSFRFVKYSGLLKSENPNPFGHALPTRRFAFYANMGAGLVRNSLVPEAEAGITWLSHFHEPDPLPYSFMSLYTSAHFFFSSDENRQHYISDNWFVNLEIGIAETTEILGLKTRSFSGGAGYLFLPKGDVFQGTTMKVFAGARLMSGLTLYPEVIATNNFKQIFPGITLKIFGFKREA